MIILSGEVFGYLQFEEEGPSIEKATDVAVPFKIGSSPEACLFTPEIDAGELNQVCCEFGPDEFSLICDYAEPIIEICDDDVDNDVDGDVDCDDADCEFFVDCTPLEDCFVLNGIDDDGDGLVDCDDPECAYNQVCDGEAEDIDGCSNNIDDDEDGYIDCEDLGCWNSPDCEETDCVDGIDNDEDGATDCEDFYCVYHYEGCQTCGGAMAHSNPGCHAGDEVQPGSGLVCDQFRGLDGTSEWRFHCVGSCCIPFYEAVCSDYADNDLNGKIDCNDEACANNSWCEVERFCCDGIDNDGNGLTDCDDLQCLVTPGPGCTCP
jgi:hypothetical protein